ncbi:hypothetical protein HOLleu_36866 [Holothuria leucospilota]|uniref:Uncharacterized protein n=1 Tax=Holothuria leucospilota TaxID=206669 RepID=A0A9Q0YKH8_HOLLE|nr:hypothetical protein HOLleu_36866 [Holothuria leucospilota]
MKLHLFSLDNWTQGNTLVRKFFTKPTMSLAEEGEQCFEDPNLALISVGVLLMKRYLLVSIGICVIEENMLQKIGNSTKVITNGEENTSE